MLCIGDIPLSVDDGYDVILSDVKPGIWRVVNMSTDEYTHLHLAWVAPGPLVADNLPMNAPKPGSDKVVYPKMEQLGIAGIKSGRLGIIDGDMQTEVFEAVGDDERAMEVLANPFSDYSVDEFVLSGGFIGENDTTSRLCGGDSRIHPAATVNDGNHIVLGKKEGDYLVEVLVQEEATEYHSNGW